MGEEEFMFMMMLVAATGFFGYWIGKARAAKDYLERGAHNLRGVGHAEPRSNDDAELARIRAALEGMAHRFDLMEQRVDFTERLVENSQRKAMARAEDDWAKGR